MTGNADLKSTLYCHKKNSSFSLRRLAPLSSLSVTYEAGPRGKSD